MIWLPINMPLPLPATKVLYFPVPLFMQLWVVRGGEFQPIITGGADTPAGVSTVSCSIEAPPLHTHTWLAAVMVYYLTQPSAQGWSAVHLFSQQLSSSSHRLPSRPNLPVHTPLVQTWPVMVTININYSIVLRVTCKTFCILSTVPLLLITSITVATAVVS